MEGLKETLREAVKKMAFRTSLDQLRKRGVKQVNVLGLDRIIRLIDEAVHRSLRTHLIGLDREEVANATKAEFLRLLKSNEDLRKAQSELELLKERAEEEIDRLRLEIATQRQALRAKLDEAARVQRVENLGQDEALGQQVAEMFQVLADRSDLDLVDVQSKVMELLLSVVRKERDKTATAVQALHDREVDRMQRRISKLRDSLDQTEGRLRQVTAMKDIDEGISSVYRDVQGLDANDAQFARKKELLVDLFKANMKLQRGA